jgi:nicotinamidase-related amidase
MSSEKENSGKLLQRDDCALIIIDAQEKLVPVMSGQERLLTNLTRLATFAGIIGLPVVLTEQEKLGPTRPEVQGALPADLRPIPKVTFDCFQTPEFSRALAGLGKKALLLAGIEAHICVAQTALSGLKDYRVQVISDATASRFAHNWVLAMDRLRQAGAVITSTEMAIFELLGRAGTEEFKAVLPLVK